MTRLFQTDARLGGTRFVGRAAIWFLLGSLSLQLSTADPPPETRVVCRSVVFAHPSSDPFDRSNLYGFNHAPSIVALPDGRLLTAWFSGPFEASVHQVILASFSSDGGTNWTPARVLQDLPHDSDFDPAFIPAGDRVWFFYTTGRHNPYPPVKNQEESVGIRSFKLFYRTSDDSAHNWSHAQFIERGVFSRSNGISLSSGELLVPLYEIPSKASVLRSADNGSSWTRHGGITTPAGAGEPSIAELKSGRIMMVLRTNDGFLWQVFSDDRGVTWGPPVRTSLTAPGSSHCIYSVGGDRLILVHNDSPSVRTPLTLRVSDDEGETWKDTIQLAAVALPDSGEEVWAREVSYPSVAINRQGQAVVVWANLTISDVEQYGDIESAVIDIGQADTRQQ
jgi:predicted neuraminidase